MAGGTNRCVTLTVVADDAALMTLIRAIAGRDLSRVDELLAQQPELATVALTAGATRANPEIFLTDIRHHVYAGDTALHIAAAAAVPDLVRDLTRRGAGLDATNRRGARPLHYAVDGGAGSPDAQRATVTALLELGSDPNATDKNGTPPLLRAVRNRCADAVDALLRGGADPHATNASGNTARDLARMTTGKGGSGSPAAKAEQARIIELLDHV
jgi:ankyrin repeat protein